MAITREEIEAGVARLQPWFHCIDVGYGIQTKTVSGEAEPSDHPRPTWKTIRRCLPEDLTGKSVLDVGCNGGFYAVEAKRRNAARVLGVDAQRLHIRQARFVRRVLGLDIEFQRMSVYDLSPRTVGQFDITLALGLVYHLKHLVLALERLFLVTRDMLILETATLPMDMQQTFTENNGSGRAVHLLGYVENPPDAQEAVYNWFLPSTGSMVALLRNVGFEDVKVFATVGDRAVVVCRKQATFADSTVLSHLTAGISVAEGPVADGKVRCAPGDKLRFRMRVENTGLNHWLQLGEPDTMKGAVRLGCHLLNDDYEDVIWELGGSMLPGDLAPSEAVTLDVVLRAPEAPGSYWLEFDMVAEHLIWFDDLGSPTLMVKLDVG
ncbi:MAG: DUF1698 domain-containing protein [Bryobacteraceae bacterium]